MSKINFLKNISQYYNIGFDLVFFDEVVYFFEPNTYYDNDETDLFIFVNWDKLSKDYIDDNKTLNEIIDVGQLKKATNLEIAVKMKEFYSKKLDLEIINCLAEKDNSLISGKFNIIDSKSNQYKYLFLYLYYFNDMMDELKRILINLESRDIIKENQQINIIFDQESYLYFGDFNKSVIKFPRNKAIYKSIVINTKPVKTDLYEQEILQFKLENPENYIELIQTEYYKLGINKAIVVLISLDQLVSEVGNMIGTIFSDNVRLYVSNTFVDNSIIRTILDNSDVFQVLHNGISIVCENATFGMNNLVINKSSIVNGAQTIFNLIKLIKLGIVDLDYLKGKYVLTKIIEIDDNNKEDTRLRISQAANTQKAINLQDLKSNHEYLIGYKSLLLSYKVDLLIKRGVVSRFINKVRIEKFAKIVYSAFTQHPGKARNSSSDRFFDEREPYFNMIFEYRNNLMYDNLRILIYLIFTHYESYKLKIDEAINTASKYAELYFVSYIFGKVLINELDSIKNQLCKKTMEIKVIESLVDKYGLKFCEELKNPELKINSNLFEAFRVEDLYRTIFSDYTNIKSILKSEFEIEITRE